ncbi:hypothetical protein GCM10010389_10620 [Streptomyces echinoruber]|uniref:Uncharacterized protein n=1 Tax=Streptomyces echinoruber TaxID=68898 RepID=A0A918QW81_9ACTN|nr:hypothetical protein GCM10010389_10620 [Streptomyces echinoruber]
MGTVAVISKQYWTTRSPIQPGSALWLSWPLGSAPSTLGTYAITAIPNESASGYYTMSVRELHITKRSWQQGDINYWEYYVGANCNNTGNLPVKNFITFVSRVNE